MNVTITNITGRTMREKEYRINEIFYSIQGEGMHTGTPAVFLRMSGCNRRCDFCDTDHSAYTLMTIGEIIDAVSVFASHHIIVTGGEPAIQIDKDMVEALHYAGFYIHIETNGTLPLPDGIDWVTVSPKDGPESRHYAVKNPDEVKIVYQAQDVESYRKIFASRHFLLQPCSGANIAETIDYILAHPHWRLSLQTHKLINVR